ncbi:MAG: response regulator transcription factor [Flavobacteriales bacterium]|nr:response regulator transcription factor [Flavobacteriales bacterium]
MIRIGIAEDQALFRKGIVGLLNSFRGFQVVVEAENGIDLLKKYEELIACEEDYPDITLLDLNMPEMDGIKATEKLKSLIPEKKIIIISSHNDQDIIVHLYEKGANAFLDKNAEPEEVQLAIRSVMQNDFYFNEAAKEALEDATNETVEEEQVQEGDEPIILDSIEMLTDREIEILRYICQEKTALEIGILLEISKRTVDGHRMKLLAKTKSKNIAGLVLFTIRCGIMSVSELKINLY